MLWAYGVLAAIKPPDVIINSVIISTTIGTPISTPGIPTSTPTNVSNVTGMGNYVSKFGACLHDFVLFVFLINDQGMLGWSVILTTVFLGRLNLSS